MNNLLTFIIGLFCGMFLILIVLINIPRPIVSKTRIHPEVTVTIHPDSTIDSLYKYVQP